MDIHLFRRQRQELQRHPTCSVIPFRHSVIAHAMIPKTCMCLPFLVRLLWFCVMTVTSVTSTTETFRPSVTDEKSLPLVRAWSAVVVSTKKPPRMVLEPVWVVFVMVTEPEGHSLAAEGNPAPEQTA